MKVTSKGQITIPKALRVRIGLPPGTDVEVIVEGDDVLIQPLQRPASDDEVKVWIERFAGSGTMNTTTDEIMRMTRGDD